MADEKQAAKKKILLVEDELYIRELYARALRQEGYDVEEVDNGEDGFNKIRDNDYDLILLDIMLPKLNGLQVLENLKSENMEEKNSKIILLTNLDQALTIANGVSQGVRAYYVKSQYTPEKLKKEVMQYFAETSNPTS
jgi:two-component system response regulator ResD